MPTAPTRDAAPVPAAPATRRGWLPPPLGIAGRLAFGLAAVAAVFVAGEVIATRTTHDALEAVRGMQQEQEPLASAANSILDRLMAYDRVVGEYVQAHEGVDKDAITRAGKDLEDAVAGYFATVPGGKSNATAAALRDELSEHIATARALADRASQRAQWAEERQAALNRVYQHIAAAGGAGVAIDNTQVFARRSLAELESAINAVRGNSDKAPTIARHEEEFRALLQLHAEDLALSPGRAWLWLVKQDFDDAVKLRQQMAHEDQVSGPQWHAVLEDSANLAADIQENLQRPARAALFRAAERASTAARTAAETRRVSDVGVLGLLLLMSVLLTLSISLPVRRLTAATRRLAGGDRTARAPRGGAAEVDELAKSFNAMADRIEHAETELLAQQAELERHVAERTRQLHHLAYHDPLTQLPNRRKLSARLAAALSSEGGRRLALLFVDVDNFKTINDTLGHSFGDRVLQQIAERLRAASGAQNLLARLGGDEFTLLLEDVPSVAEVEAHAMRIVAAMQQPLSIDGRVLTTSASVGASLYPDHAADAEGLLRAADVALFRAKELGRNRFALYSPELYDAAAQRFRLEQSLRRAVEKGELMLMYQPQVSLDTFHANDVEALLRWNRPDGRIATASEFIEAAEKTGLIHELTHWILQTGIAAAAAWRAQGWTQARIAINVSAPQFFESDFVTQVGRTLKEAGLPPSALQLEITETVFQTGPTTIESLRHLRALGVAVALDDFGIGYSSLTSLEHLPLTHVKLDRMLIASVDTNPRSAAIVRSIVALCHGLGLQVVAEGVERAAQLEFLAACGPISVQGFLVAHPVEGAHTPQEALAAGRRAQAALHGASAPWHEGSDALVFLGGAGRRRT